MSGQMSEEMSEEMSGQNFVYLPWEVGLFTKTCQLVY